MIKEEEQLAYNVCRVVGHDTSNGRYCLRCGLHKFVEDLGEDVSKLFKGHPRSKELGDYIHAYARKILDRMVRDGVIAGYTDLKVNVNVRIDGYHLEFRARQHPQPLDLIRYAIRLRI